MCFFILSLHGVVCVCVPRVGLGAVPWVVDDLMAGILFYPKFPQGSQLGQLYM